MNRQILSFILMTVLCLMCINSTLQAQDIIIMQTGEDIKVKVLEVNQTNVKYKKYGNESGPVYTVEKAKIFMIKYEDGAKDIFNETPVNPPVNPNNVPVENKPATNKVQQEKVDTDSKTASIGGDINGIVKDADGEPMPGVSVTLKGSNVGTMTGVDGKYVISVPDYSSAVLVFTFNGYNTVKTPVMDERVIDVDMEEIVRYQYKPYRVDVGVGTNSEIHHLYIEPKYSFTPELILNRYHITF